VRRPPSAYAKSLAGSLSAFCLAAVAAFGPESTLGKWFAVAAAGLGVLLTVLQVRNTAVVETGPGTEPKVTELVTKTGEHVGELVADTGAAAAGIVAGTTGAVGKAVDVILGPLLPSGERRA
jgi:drug/metabolite transporter (DMT)-like permease